MQLMESIFTKKTQILLQMNNVGEYIPDLGFLGLIFSGRGLEKHKINKGDNYYIPEDDDMTNILKSNVLHLFNNLQTMDIYVVDDYPFSYQLVSLLTHTMLRRVYIETGVNNNTWVHYLWGAQSSSLIEAYENKGYAIEFKSGFGIDIKWIW